MKDTQNAQNQFTNETTEMEFCSECVSCFYQTYDGKGCHGCQRKNLSFENSPLPLNVLKVMGIMVVLETEI